MEKLAAQLNELPEWVLYIVIGRAQIFMQLPETRRGEMIVTASRVQNGTTRLATAHHQVAREYAVWQKIIQADKDGTLDILEHLANPNAPTA